MKTAVAQNGSAILATADAPATARCPVCGGRVVLRKRRTMRRMVTYFWRHQDNDGRDCLRRVGPIR